MINGLYYGRGTPTIYDLWESRENPGWTWSDVYPLFIKVNSRTALRKQKLTSIQSTHFNPQNESKGFDNPYKTWDPEAYGDRPLEMAYQGYVRSPNQRRLHERL